MGGKEGRLSGGGGRVGGVGPLWPASGKAVQTDRPLLMGRCASPPCDEPIDLPKSVWGLPLITSHLGEGGGGTSILYISITYYMQKKGGESGVKKACKNVYVINGRPLCHAKQCKPLIMISHRSNLQKIALRYIVTPDEYLIY